MFLGKNVHLDRTIVTQSPSADGSGLAISCKNVKLSQLSEMAKLQYVDREGRRHDIGEGLTIPNNQVQQEQSMSAGAAVGMQGPADRHQTAPEDPSSLKAAMNAAAGMQGPGAGYIPAPPQGVSGGGYGGFSDPQASLVAPIPLRPGAAGVGDPGRPPSFDPTAAIPPSEQNFYGPGTAAGHHPLSGSPEVPSTPEWARFLATMREVEDDQPDFYSNAPVPGIEKGSLHQEPPGKNPGPNRRGPSL